MTRCHIFNMRYQDGGVVPASLKIKPLVRTKEDYRVAERASRALLRAHIHEIYRRKRALIGETHVHVDSFQTSLEDELDGDYYRKVTDLSYAAAEKTHATCKKNHIVTYASKKKSIELCPEGHACWVVNLSGKDITSSREEDHQCSSIRPHKIKYLFLRRICFIFCCTHGCFCLFSCM